MAVFFRFGLIKIILRESFDIDSSLKEKFENLPQQEMHIPFLKCLTFVKCSQYLIMAVEQDVNEFVSFIQTIYFTKLKKKNRMGII